MILQGWSRSVFQAKQQWSRMSAWDVKMRLESQLSRMNCHMFSTGLSSGDRAGKGIKVMLSGTVNLAVVCQPAWSNSSTAWAPGATAREISAKCSSMASVVQRGSTRPAALPSAGQMAPKMYAERVRWSCAATGRVPRRAQRRVSLFFWPMRASS